MKQQEYDGIVEAVSNDRLSAYISTSNTSKEGIISNYLNNIEVCRAFYPLLDKNSVQKINEAKNTIGLRGYNVTHGRIVAELSLGFWISFVSKRFSQYPYQSFILKNAFPNCLKYMRTLKIMQKKFENFRILRNRILIMCRKH